MRVAVTGANGHLGRLIIDSLPARGTEKLLADGGITHVLLRNGWCWENYASSIEPARATGGFFGASGTGKVSGVARRDYAEAAAVVATGEGHAGRVDELSRRRSARHGRGAVPHRSPAGRRRPIWSRGSSAGTSCPAPGCATGRRRRAAESPVVDRLDVVFPRDA